VGMRKAVLSRLRCLPALESIVARLKKRIQKQDPTIVQIFIEPAAIRVVSRSSKAA